MDKFYNIWEPVLRSFKMNCPDLYEEMVDWYPSGYLVITVKLKNGDIKTYDLVDDFVREVRTFSDYEKIDEDTWIDNFSRRLVDKMRRTGMSRDRLSYITGISCVSLSKYMNGRSIPSAYNLDRIASALKCSSVELTDIY